MKLILLCAAGALAAQDVQPPVISLSLSSNVQQTCAELATVRDGNPSWNLAHKYQALNCPAPCHKCDNATRDGDTAQSLTCEVQAGYSYSSTVATDCPEPRCTVYDHYQNGARGHTSPKCIKQYYLVNDNGDVSDTEQDTVNRALRSEWLIRYSATDDGGNDADNVTFTMIFADTQAPQLTTEFGKSGPAYERDQEYSATHSHACDRDDYEAGSCDHMWLQSCSIKNTPVSLPGTEDPSGVFDSGKYCTNNIVESFSQTNDPCKQTLDKSAVTIKDNYDMPEDINSTIHVEVLYEESPGVHTVMSSGAWDDNHVIDTQKTGEWTVKYTAHDNAGIFGFNEKDNQVEQTVTLTVTDDLPPIVTLNQHHNVTTTFAYSPAPLAFSSSGPAEDATDCANGNDNVDFKITLECRKPTQCESARKGDGDNACGSFYMEPGAKCKDLRDSWNSGSAKYVFESAAVSGANMTDKGSQMFQKTEHNTHVVDYTCEETASYGGASADRKTVAHRSITIMDRIPPAVQLNGQSVIQNSAGKHKHDTHGTDYEAATGLNTDKLLASYNAVCSDLCEKTPLITSTLHYGSDCSGDMVPGDVTGSVKNFPELIPGDYSVLYTCSDETGVTLEAGKDETKFVETADRDGLIDTVCLHIENVDYTKPIIQILGSNVMTLEATHSGNYVDDGATCYDKVDGVISQNVEVSGDVVNLSKVGTYVIEYNCKDSAGNAAEAISRTVHIAQTSCPRCTIKDCETPGFNCTFQHEASFPYTDQGATCQDSIDGAVDTHKSGTVNIEKTGEYIITYKAKNSAGLWNDEDSCDNGKEEYFRTVNVVDTLRPVVEVKFHGVVVGRSDGDGTAVHNASLTNPAHDHVFMAEQQTQSGAWVLGAVASAVAGMALLATSRKRSQQLSVPV